MADNMKGRNKRQVSDASSREGDKTRGEGGETEKDQRKRRYSKDDKFDRGKISMEKSPRKNVDKRDSTGVDVSPSKRLAAGNKDAHRRKESIVSTVSSINEVGPNGGLETTGSMDFGPASISEIVETLSIGRGSTFREEDTASLRRESGSIGEGTVPGETVVGICCTCRKEAEEVRAEVIVKQLEDLKSTLVMQTAVIRDRVDQDLFCSWKAYEEVKAGVARSKDVLVATSKFFSDYLASTATEIREMLSRSSAKIQLKLKEFVPFNDSDQTIETQLLKSMIRTTMAQEAYTELATQLRQLEGVAIEIELSINRLAVVLGQTGAEARRAEWLLRQADDSGLIGLKPEVPQPVVEVPQEEGMEEDGYYRTNTTWCRQRDEEERLRLKAEEKKRLAEEEANRKREEEERARREDPRYWPAITYALSEDEDALGSGLACIIRAPQSLQLTKEKIDCDVVDLLTNRYELGENEELVSNVICLKPANELPLDFRTTIWLAFPYIQGSRSREVVIRICESRPVDDNNQPSFDPTSWKDSLTKDTVVEGHDVAKFVETPISRLPANGTRVAVLSRLKRDREIFGGKGGKLLSSVDPRISLRIPKNAYRIKTEVSLQVWFHSTAVPGLKERYDDCEELLGISPVIRMSATTNPAKPLLMSVTQPSGGHKPRRTDNGGSKSNSSSLPPVNDATGSNVSNHNLSEGCDEDCLVLMTKESNGKWRMRDDINLYIQKDLVVFQLNEILERFILFRLSTNVDPLTLTRLSAKLETTMNERPAVVVAKQTRDMDNLLCLECCKRDSADRIAQKMREARFIDGPEPCAPLCLREGDVIQVSFRGNIDFEDRQPRKIIFYSNLSTARLKTVVKELDRYAQNALVSYRGNVRLALVERSYQAPPKMPVKLPSKKGVTVDAGYLCELLVTLPKKSKESSKINRIEIPINSEGSPLTDSYFDRLSMSLGDEWMLVADRLRISRPSLQRIACSFAHLPDANEAINKSIKHMLIQWFKSSAKAKNKVKDLKEALTAAGRNDLAEELAAQYELSGTEREKQEIALKLEKCVHALNQSEAALRSWFGVAKGLGLAEKDIAAIAGVTATILSPRQKLPEVIGPDQMKEMLLKWRTMRGDLATKEELTAVLRNLKLTEAAGLVNSIR